MTTTITINVSPELDRFLSDNSIERALNTAVTSRNRREVIGVLQEVKPYAEELWRAAQDGLFKHYHNQEH